MQIAVFYSPELRNYDFGPGHSFRGDRFAAFLEIFHKTLAGNPRFQLVNHNELASDEELGFWHTQDYINIMKAVSQVVKNSILTVDYVQQGKATKAISIGGGLHHAKAGYGEGFCIYNDVMIAGLMFHQIWKRTGPEGIVGLMCALTKPNVKPASGAVKWQWR